MTYNRKQDEQRAIDAWLNDSFSEYSLIMALVTFQKMRGLKKLYLYDPSAELDLRRPDRKPIDWSKRQMSYERVRR